MCKVEFEDSTPIFNPGMGMILPKQERPDLPWTPVKAKPARDNFDSPTLGSEWYFVRIPQKAFHNLINSQLALTLQPEIVDSLVNSAMLYRRARHHQFKALPC